MSRLVLNQASLKSNPWLLSEALRVISQDAIFLRASYPNFDKWFTETVLEGLKQGERTLVLEERDSIAVGFLILKHTNKEKKLCTLRVRPHHESRGLGVRLFQTAFDILGTDRPLLSVSETAKSKFERLFCHFGFESEAVYKDRYLPAVSEFAYNGLLDMPQQVLAQGSCLTYGQSPFQLTRCVEALTSLSHCVSGRVRARSLEGRDPRALTYTCLAEVKW